jgi:DNA polymerase-3 subunit delta'
MTKDWSKLIGNQRLCDWFAHAIRQRRLGGSFLFVGSPGIGKQTVADLLALTLMCETNAPAEMQPCGTCPSCVQVMAGTHADVIRVSKPPDKSLIPLELLIGRPEVRLQEGFCRDVRLKPSRGTRKVAILHDADYLNEEGANCLLKTLEEPPADSLIILIGTSEQRQLPTIRSRCQIIRFAPLSPHEATRLLHDVHQVEASEQAIAEAVDATGGDIHAAIRQLSGEADELRTALSAQFTSPAPDPVAMKRIITEHVEGVGKDASKRRDAMRDVFAIAIQHYRRQLRTDAAVSGVTPQTLSRLDRSVRAIREVDRSANQSTLIECYASDIASAVTGDRGQIG